MTQPVPPNSLITPDAVQAANAAGTLLSAIAAASHDDENSLVTTLSRMHNSGKIDVLDAYRSDQLDAVHRHGFFRLQRVFCQTLPKIQCLTADVLATCRIVLDKAGNDVSVVSVYDALREWFQLSQQRVEDGLTLIRRDIDTQSWTIQTVLLAGAAHDLGRFSGEALDLSRQPQSDVRLSALRALGQIKLDGHSEILTPIVDRLDEAIELPMCDQEPAVAIVALLSLHERIGEGAVGHLEPTFLKACKTPTKEMRHAIAVGLHNFRRSFTGSMIDAAFSAIQYVDKDVPDMIDTIDSTLYQWDLDGDRRRVLAFLVNLLGRSEAAIEIDSLKNFRHQLSHGAGDLTGWYVMSLLLTGNPKLCVAAERLLPHNRVLDGLDIDLTTFGLDSRWVLFLSRKILGFVTVNRPSATALLLSCLREVPDDGRADLEDLIMKYWLINYPRSIEQLRASITPNDSAQRSVKRLSDAIGKYLEGPRRHGVCNAFQPSERARQLQRNRQADSLRDAQKQAVSKSVLSQLVPQSIMLYGTGTIAYIHADEPGDPIRKEIPLGSFEQTMELPRLESIDPVGLHYAICRFRAEAPPS